MPPNTGSGTILDKFGYSFKQVANPCSSDTKDVCFEECPGTSGSGSSWEHEEPEQSVDDTVRVTTRARLPYELYKYSKNAMLIVNNADDAIEADIKIKELETTFAKFRFEVEVANIERINVQLYEKCEQFFQRDFTDYGAVALVILSAFDFQGPPLFKDEKYERICINENIVVDNFKLERNSTLMDKPKIYITEAIRGHYNHLDKHIKFMKLDRATHGHVIGFHWRARIYSWQLNEKRSRKSAETGPLWRFCKKLAAMGDNVALTEIIAQTKTEDRDFFKEFYKSSINLADRIGVVDTLDKALYFARTEDN